ncbi:MAG TPA: hypothetical protein VHY91_19630 [Pirellulales bacterium]|jgi:hypothetical protein|nr:hypothetical protein [Pirellulales bacterium]
MRFSLALTTALWLAVVIGGAIVLNLHATTPGQQSDQITRWPTASRVTRSDNAATLLVFVHPYCPCARTTLDELAAIMTTCRGRVEAQVLFVTADGENPNWEENELWQAARAIPGVRAVVDSGAIEAVAFGARTSGLTLLFDERGECLFSGGITAARGHAGDNVGRQAIVSCLANQRPETSRAPTFGCALFASESTVNSKDSP